MHLEDSNPVRHGNWFKRRWMLLLAFIGVVAFLCIQSFVRSRDPSYQGIPLSKRLEQLSEDYPPDKATAEAIARHKPQAVELMCSKLKARDSGWKKALIQVVKKQSLLNLTFHTAAELHAQGMAACKFLGHDARPAIPILTNWLYHAETAWDGARCLTYIGQESTPHLVTVLASHSVPSQCQRHAALALGRIRPVNDSVVPVLITALGNTNMDVRSSASDALTNVAVASATVIPALIQCLEESTNIATRTWSAVTLKHLEGAAHAAVPTLLRMVQHTNWAVSGNSMSALVAVDRKEAEPILDEWLLTGDGLKPLAAMNLFKDCFKDASSNVVHLFLKAMETRSGWVRERVIVTLGKMGEPAREAVPKLLDATHDSDPNVQAAAKKALASINAARDSK